MTTSPGPIYPELEGVRQRASVIRVYRGVYQNQCALRAMLPFGYMHH